jgi:hypothetical protein
MTLRFVQPFLTSILLLRPVCDEKFGVIGLFIPVVKITGLRRAVILLDMWFMHLFLHMHAF